MTLDLSEKVNSKPRARVRREGPGVLRSVKQIVNLFGLAVICVTDYRLISTALFQSTLLD